MRYFSYAYVTDAPYPDEYGSWRYSRRWFSRSNHGNALLFGCVDEVPPDWREEAVRLSELDEVKSYLGTRLLWYEDEGRLVLSDNVRATALPSNAKPENTYGFIVNGQHYDYAPSVRFGQCLRLEKAVGCQRCDLRFTPCIEEALNVKLVPEARTTDGTTTEEDFKNGVTNIGGYTFASPKLTAPFDDGMDSIFIPSIRTPNAIDFTVIPQRKEACSAASVKAAQSRKFIRDNCDKCVLKKDCGRNTKRYRYCHGRYPARTKIDAEICVRWHKRMRGWKLPAWQFWAVAYESAGLHETTYNRRHVVLGGWDYTTSGGFKINITRSKTCICTAAQMSYVEARKLFPNLPATRKEFNKKYRHVPNSSQQALYFEVMEFRGGIRGAWGSYKVPVVKALKSDGDTELWVSAGRRLSSYFSYAFSTYSGIYGCLGREPSVDQLSYR